MFEQLKNNLTFLMTERHISASQLARETGIPPTTIKRIRNSVNSNPTLVSLLPIAKFFGVSVSQLLGETHLSIHKVLSNQNQHETPHAYLPIITWEQAISPQDINMLEIDYAVAGKNLSAQSYALIVQENDWKKFSKGTLLIIDPQITPESGDYVIAYDRNENKVTVKQIILKNDGKYLKSLINENQFIELSENQKVLGIIVEYRAELRSIFQSVQP